MNTTRLEELGACSEAIVWAKRQESASAAWKNCRRADWMLWLLGRLSGPPESESRKRLVLCSCECARTALQYVPSGEDRPRICIETTERWTRGEATIEKVRAAAWDAWAAGAAAHAKALRSMCAIVRRHYPHPPKMGARGKGSKP